MGIQMQALPTQLEQAQIESINEYVLDGDNQGIDLIEDHIHSEFIENQFKSEKLQGQNDEYKETNQHWASYLYRMILKEPNLFYQSLESQTCVCLLIMKESDQQQEILTFNELQVVRYAMFMDLSQIITTT